MAAASLAYAVEQQELREKVEKDLQELKEELEVLKLEFAQANAIDPQECDYILLMNLKNQITGKQTDIDAKSAELLEAKHAEEEANIRAEEARTAADEELARRAAEREEARRAAEEAEQAERQAAEEAKRAKFLAQKRKHYSDLRAELNCEKDAENFKACIALQVRCMEAEQDIKGLEESAAPTGQVALAVESEPRPSADANSSANGSEQVIIQPELEVIDLLQGEDEPEPRAAAAADEPKFSCDECLTRTNQWSYSRSLTHGPWYCDLCWQGWARLQASVQQHPAQVLSPSPDVDSSENGSEQVVIQPELEVIDLLQGGDELESSETESSVGYESSSDPLSDDEDEASPELPERNLRDEASPKAIIELQAGEHASVHAAIGRLDHESNKVLWSGSRHLTTDKLVRLISDKQFDALVPELSPGVWCRLALETPGLSNPTLAAELCQEEDWSATIDVPIDRLETCVATFIADGFMAAEAAGHVTQLREWVKERDECANHSATITFRLWSFVVQWPSHLVGRVIQSASLLNPYRRTLNGRSAGSFTLMGEMEFLKTRKDLALSGPQAPLQPIAGWFSSWTMPSIVAAGQSFVRTSAEPLGSFETKITIHDGAEMTDEPSHWVAKASTSIGLYCDVSKRMKGGNSWSSWSRTKYAWSFPWQSKALDVFNKAVVSSDNEDVIRSLLSDPLRYATTFQLLDVGQWAENSVQAPRTCQLRCRITVELRPLAFSHFPTTHTIITPAHGHAAAISGLPDLPPKLQQTEALLRLVATPVPAIVDQRSEQPIAVAAEERDTAGMWREEDMWQDRLRIRALDAVEAVSASIMSTEVPEPDGLEANLKDYQLLTLGWMLAKERGESCDVCAVPRVDNSPLWYGRAQFFLTPPPRGGFVLQEMGLGKTVEVRSYPPILAPTLPLPLPFLPLLPPPFHLSSSIIPWCCAGTRPHPCKPGTARIQDTCAQDSGHTRAVPNHTFGQLGDRGQSASAGSLRTRPQLPGQEEAEHANLRRCCE